MLLPGTRVAAIGCLLALASCALSACGGDGGAGAGAEDAPVYYGEVEPMLREHCTGCHRADGAAPFPLDDYAAASERAQQIAQVTAERRMPPWPAHGGEDCPPLASTRELDDAQIAVLQAWARADAPQGERPPRGREPQPAPRADQLDHVDALLQSAEPYRPLPQVDDHRCFALDPALDEDRYLTAYAVREGVPGIIHHVQLWAIDDDADEQQLDQLDAADPGAGYACPAGHSLPNARYVSVWAPSDPVRRHPPGTGMLLHAGHRVLIQIHYDDRLALGLPDQTAIELELAERVELPASMWAVSAAEILLPPGVARSTVLARSILPSETAVALWGVRAHMHELGSSARLNAVAPDGAQRCLLAIPRWDPAWQLMYFYPAPVTLDPGESLEVECSYDTRSRSEPVQAGIRTRDEMCFGYFYVTGERAAVAE